MADLVEDVLPSESDLEAQFAKVAEQLAGGEPEPVAEEAPEEDPEVVESVADESDPEEERARADGHLPYDEWVKAGKDPRQWRPAAEFNRRGDMLKTGKPELINKLEEATRRSEEAARLMAEQIRMAKEDRESAFIAGREEAIRQAREEQEAAFALGDRNAHQAALAKEHQAVQDIQSRAAPAPQVDPELVAWQEDAKWFKEGFTADNKPKNEAVEAFLEFQKAHMLANPNARVVDSVRAAEAKVKRFMPEFFKPKTPQARTTAPAVSAGSQVARPTGADPLAKFNVGERQIIRDAAKAFGKTVTEYVKMIEG